MGRAIFRHLFIFCRGRQSSNSLLNLDFYSDKAVLIRMLMLIKHIYSLCGLPRLLPVTYIYKL